MKTRNAFATFTICVLLALTTTFLVNLPSVLAQPTTDCRKIVTGTYLLTHSGDFGSFRSIITFAQDGNLFVTASTQSGDPSVQPYSNVQGSWKCIGDKQITATALDFEYPTATLPGTISRSDFNATFDRINGIVQATATFRSYDLNANPLNEDAPVTATFTFTGQRVKPG